MAAGPTGAGRGGSARPAGPSVADEPGGPAVPAVPAVGPGVPDPPAPPLPINHPPGVPFCPVPGVPLVPLPISGRPVAAWTGALIPSSRVCSGDTLAASAAANIAPLAFIV